jgi:hypothetical protein
MSRVGFEPTIPVFDLSKTLHALECADNVFEPYVFIHFLFHLRASQSKKLISGL